MKNQENNSVTIQPQGQESSNLTALPASNNTVPEEPEDPLDVIPPDFDAAEKHRNANFMREIDEKVPEAQRERCPCCNKCPNTKEYALCVNTDKFASHGFGVSLFFAMGRYLTYIMGVLFIGCCAILFMYINGGIDELTIGNPDIEIPDSIRVAGDAYEDSIVNKISIGRVKYDEIANALLISCVGVIVLFYFSWVQFKTALESLDIKLNINNLTPADYTVMLSNVPVESMSEENIKKNFEINLNSIPDLVKNGPIRVFKIISTYDLVQFRKLWDELDKLRVKKHVIEYHREVKKEEDKALTDEQLDKLYPKGYENCNYKEITMKYAEIRKKMNELTQVDNIKRLNQVFVSFTRTVAEDVVEKYKLGIIRYVCSNSGYRMGNKRVQVDQAPEPEDVKWENLGYSFLQRLGRVALNTFISLVLLGVCLVANIFVSKASKEQSENTEHSQPILLLYSALFSLITTIINGALTMVIPILTVYERLSNQSRHYFSIAAKLSLSLFLNSGIIPIIIYEKSQYFTSGGFLSTIWMNWLFICFLNPVLEIFDASYVLACLKWKMARMQGSKSLSTQRQANVALEPYECSIVTKYAQLMNIMFYTGFYVIFFPPGIVITIVGLIFQYWVNKYLMITRYKVPRVSGEIAEYCMKFTGFFFPLFCLISTEIFISRFETEIMDNQILGIVIPIALLLLLYILTYCLPYMTNREQKQSIPYQMFVGESSLVKVFYDKFKYIEYDPFRFMTSDYKIANPATRLQGIKELAEYLNKKATTDQQKEIVQNFQTNLNRPGGFTTFAPMPAIPVMPIYHAPVSIIMQPTPAYTASVVPMPQGQTVPSVVPAPVQIIHPQPVPTVSYQPMYVPPPQRPPMYVQMPPQQPGLQPGPVQYVQQYQPYPPQQQVMYAPQPPYQPRYGY